ncbi:MAG: phasin family protein [Lautropia sp.]|nr:phasin family protein [Lautropia sp.]
MFPSIDDLLKAQSEAFKTSNTVATAAFDGAKKLLELNVQAARAGMEESSAQLKALMAAKDVNTLNTMLADLFAQYGKPDGSKAASYVKNVYEITQETSAQVSALIEQQVSSTQRQLLASVDTLVKNAPAGSESAVNLLKQSVVNANAAYEQLQAASKQVLEMIDANIAGLSKAASTPKKK